MDGLRAEYTRICQARDCLAAQEEAISILGDVYASISSGTPANSHAAEISRACELIRALAQTGDIGNDGNDTELSSSECAVVDNLLATTYRGTYATSKVYEALDRLTSTGREPRPSNPVTITEVVDTAIEEAHKICYGTSTEDAAETVRLVGEVVEVIDWESPPDAVAVVLRLVAALLLVALPISRVFLGPPRLGWVDATLVLLLALLPFYTPGAGPSPKRLGEADLDGWLELAGMGGVPAAIVGTIYIVAHARKKEFSAASAVASRVPSLPGVVAGVVGTGVSVAEYVASMGAGVGAPLEVGIALSVFSILVLREAYITPGRATTVQAHGAKLAALLGGITPQRAGALSTYDLLRHATEALRLGGVPGDLLTGPDFAADVLEATALDAVTGQRNANVNARTEIRVLRALRTRCLWFAAGAMLRATGAVTYGTMYQSRAIVATALYALSTFRYQPAYPQPLNPDRVEWFASLAPLMLLGPSGCLTYHNAQTSSTPYLPWVILAYFEWSNAQSATNPDFKTALQLMHAVEDEGAVPDMNRANWNALARQLVESYPERLIATSYEVGLEEARAPTSMVTRMFYRSQREARSRLVYKPDPVTNEYEAFPSVLLAQLAAFVRLSPSKETNTRVNATQTDLVRKTINVIGGKLGDFKIDTSKCYVLTDAGTKDKTESDLDYAGRLLFDVPGRLLGASVDLTPSGDNVYAILSAVTESVLGRSSSASVGKLLALGLCLVTPPSREKSPWQRATGLPDDVADSIQGTKMAPLYAETAELRENGDTMYLVPCYFSKYRVRAHFTYRATQTTTGDLPIELTDIRECVDLVKAAAERASRTRWVRLVLAVWRLFAGRANGPSPRYNKFLFQLVAALAGFLPNLVATSEDVNKRITTMIVAPLSAKRTPGFFQTDADVIKHVTSPADALLPMIGSFNRTPDRVPTAPTGEGRDPLVAGDGTRDGATSAIRKKSEDLLPLVPLNELEDAVHVCDILVPRDWYIKHTQAFCGGSSHVRPIVKTDREGATKEAATNHYKGVITELGLAPPPPSR